jgi:type I restriction enzyme S subunit
METMSKYDSYKDSGVEWLGKIPSHWLCLATKHAYKISLGKMLQPNRRTSHDIEVPYLKSIHVQWDHIDLDELPTMWATPSDVEKYSVTHNDLLVCEGGEVGRSAILDSQITQNIIIQNALHRVRGKFGNSPKYLMYLLYSIKEANWFEVLCSKATIAHFTAEKFGALVIPLPSQIEQLKIVAFLDKLTAEIEAAIAKKKQLIDLLQEQKNIFISQVVIRGLNHKSPMKNSGVEWIGDIPKHWQLLPNKALFRERNESGHHDLPILSVSLHSGVSDEEQDGNENLRAKIRIDDKTAYKRVYPGDVTYNMMRAWQGAIGVVRVDGLVSPAYVVAASRANVH